VQREITLGQAMAWILAFVGGAAALSGAFLLFLADREEPATAFTSGGLALLLWTGIHLTTRQPQHS